MISCFGCRNECGILVATQTERERVRYITKIQRFELKCIDSVEFVTIIVQDNALTNLLCALS
ncbi:hypothetical protein HanIR_Chr11g0527951 [Helianthus annuus]|nr:hypothetical protein HanIR_Chr11g0527951 [Helianthus annuus]